MAYDVLAHGMGYSRPSLSKDLRIFKDFKARGMNCLHTSFASNYVNCLRLPNSSSSGGMTMVSERDIL